MKLLLDTHVWLWWQMAPERLSKAALSALGEEGNDVFLSAVSSWEMAIKIAAGRLQLPRPLGELVPESLMQDGFINLPIQPAHCFALAELPMHHRDPFDKMLVCQSIEHGLTILTSDKMIIQYPVSTIW